MSVLADKSRLVAVTKELSRKWQETQLYWKDARSEDFERKYMEQLLLHIVRAVAICEKLDKILTKVRNDCE